jgi:hypothetical protein
MAHAWSCHNIDDGYFYKCPESMMLRRVLDGDGSANAAARDAVKIEKSPRLATKLLAYLCSPEPLDACRRCLGSAGKLFAHEELPRRDWREPQRHTTEELVDLQFLEVLESEWPGAPWMCTRNDLENPENRALVERLKLGNGPAAPVFTAPVPASPAFPTSDRPARCESGAAT